MCIFLNEHIVQTLSNTLILPLVAAEIGGRIEGAYNAPMTTTEPPKRLPPRHARFVAEYLEDFNATQAYLRAGNSPLSASANASRLLGRPEIAAAIAEGRRRITQSLAIGAERMAREYARIAFANVDDFISVDGDGAVRIDVAKADRAKRAGLVDLIVTEGTETRPRQVRIKLGKLRALDQLTKRLDLFGEKPASEVSAEAHGHLREVIEGLQRVLAGERERRADLEQQLRLAQAPLAPPESYEALKQWAAASPAGRR